MDRVATVQERNSWLRQQTLGNGLLIGARLNDLSTNDLSGLVVRPEDLSTWAEIFRIVRRLWPVAYIGMNEHWPSLGVRALWSGRGYGPDAHSLAGSTAA